MLMDQKDLKIWLETGVWLGIPNYEPELRANILEALKPTYTEVIDLLKQVVALQQQLADEKRKNIPKIIEKPVKRSVAVRSAKVPIKKTKVPVAKTTKTPVKKTPVKKRGS